MSDEMDLLRKLIAGAMALAPKLREGATASEVARRIDDETIAAMKAADLFRILTPMKHGGLEAGLRAQIETLFVVAAADPAAGWVQMVSNAHAWMVGSFPHACQAAVFANGPSGPVPGTLAAQGRAESTDDGWLLNGRWQFASGVDHGEWIMLGASAKRTDRNPHAAVHLIVAKSDLVVDDTWFTMGLRGTGSKDLIADGVFVPGDFAMPTRVLFDGLSPHGEGHVTHLNRLPVLVCLSVQLAGAVVGIASGAFDAYQERTATRSEIYTGSAKAEKVGPQLRIAESRVELDTAAMLLRDAADRCDRVGVTGEYFDLAERAELKYRAAYAVELARRATERLFAASGAHSVYNDSVLQARYRDVNTACHHAVVDIDGSAEIYGRTLLGLEPNSPLV